MNGLRLASGLAWWRRRRATKRATARPPAADPGSMTLNVTFERDANGRERSLITDDQGRRLPCVRALSVDYDVDGPSRVRIELVVDRRRVTVGDRTPAPG